MISGQFFFFSERTIEAYVRAVRQLAEHFNKPPDTITEEELKAYFLYNRNVRKWSRAASSISICGIKFFYIHTLGKEWTTFKLVRPPKGKSLPEILSINEVKKLFSCVKMEYHKICLKTIYSLGLRLQEGTHLQVSNIDSDRIYGNEYMQKFEHNMLPSHLMALKNISRYRTDIMGILHPKNRMIFNIIRLLLRAKFQIPVKYFNYQSGLTGIKCPKCSAAMVFVETLDRALP